MGVVEREAQQLAEFTGVATVPVAEGQLALTEEEIVELGKREAVVAAVADDQLADPERVELAEEEAHAVADSDNKAVVEAEASAEFDLVAHCETEAVMVVAAVKSAEEEDEMVWDLAGEAVKVEEAQLLAQIETVALKVLGVQRPSARHADATAQSVGAAPPPTQ